MRRRPISSFPSPSGAEGGAGRGKKEEGLGPLVDDDPELAAIRARLKKELMQQAQAPSPTPAAQAPPPQALVPDVDEADFEAFVRGHENVVVDCWAPWCGPCRIVGPIVEELARDMAGRVRFAKLNTDMNQGIAQAFGIMSIPTLLVFRNARLVDRIVGAHPKPQLAALLDRHFGRRSAGSAGPRRM